MTECYKHIKTDKTEQDWSSNQFAVNASKYSAYWLELVNNLVKIWFKSDLHLIQHLFRFLASFNQFLLSFRQTHFFVLRVINRCLW